MNELFALILDEIDDPEEYVTLSLVCKRFRDICYARLLRYLIKFEEVTVIEVYKIFDQFNDDYDAMSKDSVILDKLYRHWRNFHNISPHKSQILHILQLAADSGNTDALVWKHQLKETNIDYRCYHKNLEIRKKAFKIYESESIKGNLYALKNLMVSVDLRDCTPQQYKKYKDRILPGIKRCAKELGNPASINYLGCLMEENYHNYSKALKCYRRAASLGWSNAQKNLFDLYFKGVPGLIPKNEKFAIAFLRAAISNHDDEACRQMAEIFMSGECELIPKDTKKAKRLFKLSMSFNNTKAMNDYGYYCETGGFGDKPNLKKAKYYYKRAANFCDVLGFCNLALTIENKKPKRALKWLKRGARRNCFNCYYHLARFHRDGIAGLHRSNRKALKYYNLAKDAGHMKALVKIEKITQLLRQ